MKTAVRVLTFLVSAYCLFPVVSRAQTVASLTLSPPSIAGGSGGSSTGTVMLSAPAPAGGTVVALSSSNTDLAASAPSVTVPAGTTSATFTVGTNALYRRYSGLSFTATITASANGSSASAALTVTAQPLPPDITGDSCQREGLVCGGSFPAGQGEAGILYECFVAPTCNGMNGTCTFREECALGCQSNPADGFKFSDACATTGLFPVTLNPNYLVGGSSSAGTIQLSAPASAGSAAAAYTNNVFSSVSAVDPLPAGATSAGFTVFTEPVAVPNFAGIYGAYVIPVPTPRGGTFFQARIGLEWLTFVPPPGDPPGAISNFTLSPTTVVAGQASQATITLTKAAPAGGASIKLGADAPIVSIPTSTTVPQGATTLTFPVCTVNGPGSAKIAAAYGGVIKTAGITTTAPPTLSILSFTLSPSTVVGGASSTATITLSGPASCSGAPVYPSGNSSVAQVPAIVTVPSGATSASFTISTSPVASCTSVNIPLFFGGVWANTATLVITPPGGSCVTVTSLSLNPSSVTAGASSTGTVSLSAPAPAGGAVVSLGSTNLSVATTPSSVTVPGGATSASFTVTTGSVGTTTGVSIWASLGSATVTAALIVNPAAACTPTTCVAQGKNCGTISDGCGGSLICGTCTAPETCGGGGVANVCGGGTTSTVALTLTATGRSGEWVSSSPAGLTVNVGSTGTANFTTGALVTLTVSNGRDAVWSDGCSSGGNKTKSCSLTMNAATSVTANVQ